MKKVYMNRYGMIAKHIDLKNVNRKNREGGRKEGFVYVSARVLLRKIHTSFSHFHYFLF